MENNTTIENTTEVNRKATVDNFLERHLKLEESYEKPKIINVEGLGELHFKKLKPLEYTSLTASFDNIENIFDTWQKLIYHSCKQLQDPELHKELGIKDCYDVVLKILTIAEITKIGQELMSMMENLDIVEAVKK